MKNLMTMLCQRHCNNLIRRISTTCNARFNSAILMAASSTSIQALPLFQQGALQTRHYSSYQSLPSNTIVMFVPQQEAWVVERMGKFHKVLEPGLNILIPILDRVKYVQVLKEQAIKIPEQSAVTRDNVGLHIDGVLYVRVDDPFKASYGVENPEYAVTQLAQTTMRSEIGKLTLDAIFQEREVLNINIVKAINLASEGPWGIRCLRYEIRDITVPARVQEAMQMQVAAERKKRAQVLESEGMKESAINVAQGKRQSQILESESDKIEKINLAEGEAKAILSVADAKAKAIRTIADSLSTGHGANAASLSVAEQYVKAFGNLAKEGNTILLPSNTGEVSSMVSQAMSIYSTLNKAPNAPTDQSNDLVNENLIDMPVYSDLGSDEYSDVREVQVEGTPGEYMQQTSPEDNLKP